MTNPATEEDLREACCIGDTPSVKTLLAKGLDVNSKNPLNGWTPLHWAAKRGHKMVVELLLEHGADINILNSKGERPLDVVSSGEVAALFGATVVPKQSKEDKDRFIPNYLANPVFPYAQKYFDQDNRKNVVEKSASLPEKPEAYCIPNSRQKDKNQKYSEHSLYKGELILKVRDSSSRDKDFYEAYLSMQELTMNSLRALCASELGIEVKSVWKIRKLPNTIMRTDKNVSYLNHYDELEIVVKQREVLNIVQ